MQGVAIPEGENPRDSSLTGRARAGNIPPCAARSGGHLENRILWTGRMKSEDITENPEAGMPGGSFRV